MLQGADRAGTCRRTSSCRDSQTHNHANSRHCWTDMRPVNLHTTHKTCEQCRQLKVSLCSANKLLYLVSCVSQLSRGLLFAIATFPHHHFNTTILAFYDCCQQNWKRSHSWRVRLPHCPTIIQITLTLVRLCLSWSEVNCFVLYAMWLSLSHLMWFVLPEIAHILLGLNFLVFYIFWGFFTFLLLIFHKFLEQNKHFNPLPVQFKALLHGQKGCVFSSGHLNFRTAPETGLPSRGKKS